MEHSDKKIKILKRLQLALGPDYLIEPGDSEDEFYYTHPIRVRVKHKFLFSYDWAEFTELRVKELIKDIVYMISSERKLPEKREMWRDKYEISFMKAEKIAQSQWVQERDGWFRRWQEKDPEACKEEQQLIEFEYMYRFILFITHILWRNTEI